MATRDAAVVLERICTLLRGDLRQRGLPHELQPVHVEALLYLAAGNRYSDSPQAVAEYLGLTKGTVSQTLKVLERRKLIRKRGDEKDRRRVRLELSPAGRRLAERIALPQPLDDALQGMGTEADRLQVGLRQLLVELQRATNNRSFGVCHTCRFFLVESSGFRCGLTGEALSDGDSKLICREHEAAV